MSKPAYLIDASIYIFQAYFSPHLEVYSSDRREISAFYGYAQFLLRFLRQTQPRFVMAAFDESLFCGFRHGLYPNYKSNRVLPDEELARQLAACAKLTRAMGVSHYGSKVYEADDIIGTVATRLTACEKFTGEAISIVTRDKDLAQVLRLPKDHLYDFNASSRRFEHDIITQYGIRPAQFPDFLGLVGDAVDAIPGVPGLGPVAAKCLFERFETLEQIYEQLEDVANLSFRGAKTAAKRLVEFELDARLSKQLATIVLDVSCPNETFSQVGSSDLFWRIPNVAGVDTLLREEGFNDQARERYLALLPGLYPLSTPS